MKWYAYAAVIGVFYILYAIFGAALWLSEMFNLPIEMGLRNLGAVPDIGLSIALFTVGVLFLGCLRNLEETVKITVIFIGAILAVALLALQILAAAANALDFLFLISVNGEAEPQLEVELIRADFILGLLSTPLLYIFYRKMRGIVHESAKPVSS